MKQVLSNSLQEYLKTIYELNTKTKKVRVTDIARQMQCSKPSVTRAVDTLRELEMVEKEAYGEIIVTKKGEVRAKEIMRRYMVLKLFLTEVLEIKEENADKEAQAMKNAISEETAIKLEQYTSQILDLGDLDCGYNKDSEKCKQCIKITAKVRLEREKKENRGSEDEKEDLFG